MLRITLVLFIIGEAVALKDPTADCGVFKSRYIDFELSNYMGIWYEVRKTILPFKSRPIDGSKCGTARYTLDKSGSFKIEHGEIPLRFGKPLKPVSATGMAVPNPRARSGLFTVKYTSFGREDFQELYQLIGTDYKNWAAVLDCRDFGRERSARIYSRTPNPPDLLLDAAYKALRGNERDFSKTDRTNCPKFY